MEQVMVGGGKDIPETTGVATVLPTA